MEVPGDPVLTSRPSVRASMIYTAFRTVAPPMVRRFTFAERQLPMGDRLTRVGRRVNRLAQLQRMRRFRDIYIARYDIGKFPVEVICAANCRASLDQGAILYFHGGGFVTGSLDSHLHVAATLASRTQLPVVHVGYRQYPDVMIDGSVEDCVSAYQWLLEHRADPSRVVMAGDSAGGFLAFATALQSQERGVPAAAGVVGISAILELDSTARNVHDNVLRDPFGVPIALPGLIEQACPSPTTAEALSPINGRLETMPPALFIVAETEILRCDAERLRDALEKVGRPCTLEVWAGQLHAFPAMFPFLPESKAAFDSITRFIHECVGVS